MRLEIARVLFVTASQFGGVRAWLRSPPGKICLVLRTVDVTLAPSLHDLYGICSSMASFIALKTVYWTALRSRPRVVEGSRRVQYLRNQVLDVVW